MIHPSIKVSGTNLNEIVNCLKGDISFILFKNSVKKDFMSRRRDAYNFNYSEYRILCNLNNFYQHCYEGKITEIEEHKRLFLKILQNYEIHYNIINNIIDKINSMTD